MNTKENLLRAINHDKCEWVPNGMENVITIGAPVIERPWREGRDAFGVQWLYDERAEGGTYPKSGDYLFASLDEWQSKVTFPDIESLNWDQVAQQAASIDRDNYLVQGFVEMGLFERSYLLMGMENALITYMVDPDGMSNLLSALADYKIALINKFHEMVHLDMVWYGDDWGSQNNLFVPVETWRAVIKPHTARIYESLRANNIIINQHSCGKVEAIIGDLVEMGVSIWNPCQPCNDLAALKRRHGRRLTFCGGIDSQFVLDKKGVTADEVRQEVRKRIDELGAGGGYIAAPSHSVPYDPMVLQSMNDEIGTYGKAIYSQYFIVEE